MGWIRDFYIEAKGSRTIRDITALFLSRIYMMLVSMLSSIVVVRYLGPEKNGIYSYSLAFVSLFGGIGLAGLTNILIKEFSTCKRAESDVFRSSFIVRAAGTLLACLLLYIAIRLVGCESQTQVYIWIASLSFVINIFSAVTGWLYASSNAKVIAWSQIISHTVCVVLRLLFVYLRLGIAAFIVVQVLETGLLLLIQWIVFWIRKSRSEVSQAGLIKRETIVYLARQGLPICLGSVAYMLFMRVDQVMIGEMLGDYDLGIYSVATKIAELWYFVPMTVVSVLMPKLSELYHNNRNEFYASFQRYMSFLVLFGYVSSIVTMLISKWLIWCLYGREFIAATPILCLYIWSGVFVNMSVLRGYFFVLTEWTQYSLWVNLAGAVINIILNFILIRYVGSMGAAIATLVSYAVYAYFTSLLFPKLRTVGRIQTRALCLKTT
jgi:O-antigen/teichoic acid export membrane protein